MSEIFDHDLIVVGGGSAGHAAAKKAASAGLNTALIEHADELGGLCILHGCMPSKTLIETANRMREIRRAATFGITVPEPSLDLTALRERLHSLTGEFQEPRLITMQDGEYLLIRGKARFTSLHDIEITGKDGSIHGLRARTFIIATGSAPDVPPLPGLEGTPYWTSDEAVSLPRLPKHLAILGAGAIGMECAHLYEGLGSQVTLIARGSKMLPGHDGDLSKAIEAESRDRGIQFRPDSEISKISYQDGKFSFTFENSATALHADAFLIATGRKPLTQGLGLETIGVARDRGRILIDERCVTSLKHIFAAGDCASPLAVVHLAVQQGEVAARNACRLIREGHSSSPAEWNRDTLMAAWFTEPQCIEIGLGEEAAHRQNIPILIGIQHYSDQGKGIIAGATHGFVKVIASAETRKLLGAVGIGPEVAETGHLLQHAIEQQLTVEDYLALSHYHPTFAEAWSRAVESIAAKNEN